MRIVNILGTSVEETAKGILAKVGTYLGTLATSLITSEKTAIWQQYGFASRHKAADDEGCAEGLLISSGGTERIVATRDLRFTKVLGELEEGDSALYAAVEKNSVGLVVVKATGQILLYSPTDHDGSGTPTKAHMISIDPAGDAIIIGHQNGSSVMLTNSDIRLTSKSGTQMISMTDSGITIGGNISLIGNVAVQGNLALLLPPTVAGTNMLVP